LSNVENGDGINNNPKLNYHTFIMRNLIIVALVIWATVVSFAQVDVRLEKNLLTSPPFQFGLTLGYEIKITNNGTVPINNIVVRDTVPCGLSFVSSSVTWTVSGNVRTTTITTPINAGESRSIFIDFTIQGCTASNAWRNVAQIVSFTDGNGSPLTDPIPTNNIAAVVASIYDLALRSTMITPQPYVYGSTVDFRIVVFNQGNEPVTNVQIRDFVPVLSGLGFNAAANTGWAGTAPTITRLIPGTLNPGDSVVSILKLELNRTVGNVRSWSNYAEILSAIDASSNIIFDADSSPGSNSITENNVLPGSTNDNNIFGQGPSFGQDEDDHDPANAIVFDLALTKNQATALRSFSYIQSVPYIFTVYNQGNTPATNIVVSDYLSPALEYVATPLNVLRGWTYNSGTRTAAYTFTKVLQPGQLDTFILDLKINQFYSDPDMVWTDFGEITQADDTNPQTPNPILDIDSRPDNIQNNDAGGKHNSPSDDYIDGDGTGVYLSPIAATDEDDHDVHKIQVVDLALTKTVVGSPNRSIGEDVQFAIKVHNQGNVYLKNIQIVDSIGRGYAFISGGTNANWTGTYPKLSTIITPILEPLKDTTIFITLRVLANDTISNYYNYAEVVIAQDTSNFNRNDDADGVFDNELYNDNLAIPGSPDDDNILGDANLGQDEDDHDVAGISVFCPKPTLTIGNPICETTNYSLMFYSSATNVSASVGTVSGSRIINIPFGSDVTVTATSAAGCTTTLNFPGLVGCGSNDCSLPLLSVGQPICNGSTYSVSFTYDIGTLAVSAGTIVGNTVVNIPVGSNLIISSTDGTCQTRITVQAPTDCATSCANPPISISGPTCNYNGSTEYSINYISLPGAVVTSSVGTVNNGTITNIPNNVSVTLTVTLAGCTNHVIVVPAPVCPICEKPTLTIGTLECNPTSGTYSVAYYSSSGNIAASAGNITSTKITNIPLGTPVTITARESSTCLTQLTTPGLPVCPPSNCVLPKLSVGQPICNGNTYTVSMTNDVGTVTTSAGTISGNRIVNIPIGTNIIVTATNGACIVRINVTSPIDCNTPCVNPAISISGPLCEPLGNGTFMINYVATPGAIVDIFEGTDNNGTVTGIPTNVPFFINVSSGNCSEKTILVGPVVCESCEKPVLTLGLPECNQAAGTYSVLFYTSVGTVTASAGQVSGSRIINIPLGTPLTVTARVPLNITCFSSLSIPAYAACPPSDCLTPKLTVGQPLCDGNGYSVSFSNDFGIVTTNAGTIVGNDIINIPIGTNITVTATNGACVASVNVGSPTDCNIPCRNPGITISGPLCENNAALTYKANFRIAPGTVVTASLGQVSGNTIINIPNGQPTIVTVTQAGCSTKSFTVPPAVCENCEKPVLTVGLLECNQTSGTYSVMFFSSVPNVIASAGIISGGRVINIPFGTPLTLTARTSLTCFSSISVPAYASCPPASCTIPKLSVGQPLCEGITYSVAFANDLGVVTSNVGTVVGTDVINIPIGTNLNLTATNGACIARITVVSPEGCDIPCRNPGITISGPLCQNNGALTYKANFRLSPGATVSSSFGSISGNMIVDMPSGQSVVVTVTNAPCSNKSFTIPPAVCQVAPGRITTFVWHDLNGDGLQSSGEPGIPAATVQVVSKTGVVIATSTTDIMGNVSFNNIAVDTYCLRYINMGDFLPTFFNRGSNDNIDSDLTGQFGPGSTHKFFVGSNITVSDVDAGFYRCAQVGDDVWYDTNKNDIHDPFENGLNGIDVFIWKREGSIWVIWDQTTTGQKPNTQSEDGYFKFCVPPGTYYVHVEIPPISLVPSMPNKGSNEEIDSDVTGIFGSGSMPSFTIGSGDMKCDLGAGFYPMATLGNLVWIDDNINGIQDQGEGAISNVIVEARDPSTNEVLVSSVTNNEGIYTLDYLQQRPYYLKFTPPTGYYATLPYRTANANDSDVDHSNGFNTTATINTVSGETNQNIDMGVVFAPLPVTWQGIDAINRGDYHQIIWSISREINTSHYIVERKLETESEFYPVSSSIYVTGDRVDTKQYNFNDSLVSEVGTYYYRVRSIDFDGQEDVSDIATVRQSGTTEMSIYPNPTVEGANVNINLVAPSNISINLYNRDGRLINTMSRASAYDIGKHVIQLPMTDMPAGVYRVDVSVNGEVKPFKLIKIK
jgi:uncharacterized repeat protein (TIGR01451 family)